MAQCEASYGFVVEYYDTLAEIWRNYRLTYFVKKEDEANEIELFDLKNKRLFLKRVSYPSISVGDLFLGSTLLIYARQLKIVDFCDPVTRAKFGGTTPFLVLVPHFEMSPKIGRMIDEIERGVDPALRLRRLRTVRLAPSDARELTKALEIEGSLAQDLSKSMTLVLEMTHPEGADMWDKKNVSQKFEKAYFYETRAFSGEPALAAIEMLLGNGDVKKSTSKNPASTRELASARRSTATMASAGTTCCVVKPHAVQAGAIGRILHDIVSDGRWKVTAIKSVRMSLDDAESFLEVYRGVVKQFKEYADELCASNCVVMEIAGGDDVVSDFRAFAGPFQWDFAKKLRPTTLRAKYGSGDVQNAIHCTDLKEDAARECRAVFSA